MDDIFIRFADHADAEVIADISRNTFYDSFASHNTAENMDKFMKEQFSKETLVKEVGAEGNTFLVACAGEKIIAYARMRESGIPTGTESKGAIEIARIYATKKHIGRGVGKALMHQCITTAIEKRKDMIWLGVWEHNYRAIEFYSRMGFEKFGEHIFMLGDDAQTDWLMRKKLK